MSDTRNAYAKLQDDIETHARMQAVTKAIDEQGVKPDDIVEVHPACCMERPELKDVADRIREEFIPAGIWSTRKQAVAAYFANGYAVFCLVKR